MPKALTSFRLVLTATMCLAVASAPNSAVSHVLQGHGAHGRYLLYHRYQKSHGGLHDDVSERTLADMHGIDCVRSSTLWECVGCVEVAM